MIQRMNHLNLEQQIRLKQLMNHEEHARILVKVTIIVLKTTGDAALNNTNKKVISKNCLIAISKNPFTICITKINNKQVDNTEDIDIVMLIYNSIEYNGAYSKTLGSLQQYYRDELALDGKSSITDFPAKVTNRNSFKFKQQIKVQIENCGRRDVAVMVQLKDLRNFWKTLEMPLINCEITFQWTCSKKVFQQLVLQQIKYQNI